MEVMRTLEKQGLLLLVRRLSPFAAVATIPAAVAVAAAAAAVAVMVGICIAAVTSYILSLRPYPFLSLCVPVSLEVFVK